MKNISGSYIEEVDSNELKNFVEKHSKGEIVQYPPNLFGFCKAVLHTIIGKKPKPRIPKEEKDRLDRDGYISNDPGEEFWQAKLREYIEQTKQEETEIDKRIFEDYESKQAEKQEADEEPEGKDSDENPGHENEETTDSSTNEAGTDGTEETSESEADAGADRDEAGGTEGTNESEGTSEAGSDGGANDFSYDIGSFDSDFGGEI